MSLDRMIMVSRSQKDLLSSKHGWCCCLRESVTATQFQAGGFVAHSV